MLAIVPWDALVARIAPFAPAGTTGRPPYPVLLLLRVHFLQQWFALSDEAAEDALHDFQAHQAFAGIDHGPTGITDATTILRFRHLPGRHDLTVALLHEVNALLGEGGLMVRRGTLVDAKHARAPRSTKNRTGTRDVEMHQTRKGNQRNLGMKAHYRVDADTGLVHTVVATLPNVHDLAVAGSLLHGGEAIVHGDAGYRGVARWWDTPGVAWMVAMPPVRRRLLAPGSAEAVAERAKASVRAKVAQPFRVIKRQFGHMKARYRGLAQNGSHLVTLFALSNLCMARRILLAGCAAPGPRAHRTARTWARDAIGWPVPGAATGQENAARATIPGNVPRKGRGSCLVQPFPGDRRCRFGVAGRRLPASPRGAH